MFAAATESAATVKRRLTSTTDKVRDLALLAIGRNGRDVTHRRGPDGAGGGLYSRNL
jgi:hypothetical protein